MHKISIDSPRLMPICDIHFKRCTAMSCRHQYLPSPLGTVLRLGMREASSAVPVPLGPGGLGLAGAGRIACASSLDAAFEKEESRYLHQPAPCGLERGAALREVLLN